MRAIRRYMAVCFFVAVLSVVAADQTYWRIVAAETTTITDIKSNGTIVWSNTIAGNHDQVQRASTLWPVADWQNCTLVPVTGVTASVKAFELNPPRDMIFIPAGIFSMGNATNVFSPDEGSADELPQHIVQLRAFYMDQYEVTKALWDEVANWAITNNYDINSTAGGISGKPVTHPVHNVSWYECLKWCNARSEKEGLAPCYTTNGYTYKTGNNSNVVCNWSAIGYRLPSEAEWEKAARGGSEYSRFPWTDLTNNITHAKANYFSTNLYSYDISPTRGYHPAYTNGVPYSSPVGSFPPNGYGLYDMAGNVWEWCWDHYSSTSYLSSAATDPTGPASGTTRIIRGGSWNSVAGYAGSPRCSYRERSTPTSENNTFGFRCARGVP